MTVWEAMPEPFVRIQGWSGDDDLTHVVCCEDADLSLCGQDISDGIDTDDDLDDNACIVCAELDPTDFCPRFLTCRGER